MKIDKKEIKKEYDRANPNCNNCIWKQTNTKEEPITGEDENGILICYGYDIKPYSYCELKDSRIFLPKIKAKKCNYYYGKDEEDNEI